MAWPTIAFAAGIVIDRWGWVGRTSHWVNLAVAGAIAAAVAAPGSGRWTRIALLAAFLALGGGRHHAAWFDTPPDDASREDWSQPKPVWARGEIADLTSFRPGAGASGRGVTRTLLSLSALNDGEDWRPVSGTVQLIVNGDGSHLLEGDEVAVIGMLSEPPAPLNPGEYDERDRLRAQGVRLSLFAESPEAIKPQAHSDSETFTLHDRVRRSMARALALIRVRCRRLLISGLDAATAPLALALLLGRREAVDPETNDAFARTGTTHLLAISGLHLQVLAVALLFLCRLAGIGRKSGALWVAVAVPAYALLVGLAPSVVRSTVMTLAGCLAVARDRPVRPGNVLALAALATLALNPSYLFDVGCQLSFLAVAAIVWLAGPVIERIDATIDPLDRLERSLEPAWKKGLRSAYRVTRDSLIISLVVTIVCVPLTSLRFHVISPIGVLLNLPLIPLTSLALVTSGLTLALSAIHPALEWLPARATDALLHATGLLVRFAAQEPWGHFFDPGPPEWFVAGFYLVLAGAVWLWIRTSNRIARSAAALAAAGWSVVGLCVSLAPYRPPTLEVETLAVGHGLCVVIQDSSGRVIVYDCGKMRDPAVGRRVVAPALWSRRIRRISAVILSHADADHYNGLADLLDRFAVESVHVPPRFGGGDNPDAERLMALLEARKIPLERIDATKEFALAQGGRIRILHPPRDWNEPAADNARSVVAMITGAGGSYMLTGDLEGPGLELAMRGPAPEPTLLLSPHHGGLKSNTPAFFAWARAGAIIASRRPPIPNARDALADRRTRGTRVWETWRDGAVLSSWRGDRIFTSGFVERSRGSTSRADAGFSRAAMTVVGIALGACAALALLVIEWGAWALTAPRRKRSSSAAPARGQGRRELLIEADDGVMLAASLLDPDRDARGAVILVHGFAEDGGMMLPAAERLVREGWRVIVYDQRAHGKSGGELVSFGGRETSDLMNVISVARDRGIPSNGPIVVWGRSMGAAVALRAASLGAGIGSLVLEAPYLDLLSATEGWLARLRIPGFLARAVLWRAARLARISLRWPRPIDLAPAIATPVLIAHGALDPVVPLAEARRLAAAFAGPSFVIDVPRARHVDVLEIGGAEAIERICRFMRESAAQMPEPQPRETAERDASGAANPKGNA